MDTSGDKLRKFHMILFGQSCEEETWRKKRISFKSSRKNAVRTNYIKVKIVNTHKNSVYRLCSERDKTVYHIISKWHEKKTSIGITRLEKESTRDYYLAMPTHDKYMKQNLSKKMKPKKFAGTLK